jgi:trigger factor
MKKKFLAVALILSMTASLAACGKGGSSSEKAQGKKSEPKITLCEYKGIALKSVSDEEIQKKIDSYVAQYFYENIEIEGPVESGDTAYINYVGKKDGVAFAGGTDQSEEGTALVIGSNYFIPGFEDGIIGMKKGETKALDLTFPEDYGNEELNGAAVVFDVTVKKITRKNLLELNDENVKKLLKYETVQAFNDAVSHDLNYESYTEQLGTHLSENCKTEDLPEDEINEYCESVYSYAVQSVQQYAQMYGADELTMLQYSLGFESYEALHDYCLEGATQNVAYQYIIKEIANKENIEVTDEVMKERGTDYAEQYGYSSVDELITNVGENKVKEAVLMDLTIEFLIDNAKIF